MSSAAEESHQGTLPPSVENPRILSIRTHHRSVSPTSSWDGSQLSFAQERTRKLSLPRTVTKDGEVQFEAKHVEKQKRRYLWDIFTSLTEIKWRWAIFSICLVYFGSWTIFACAWYTILYIHGDLDNYGNATWRPCVTDIRNFATVFLFSVETQHTIGYGNYYVGDECPQAIILLCLQAICGIVIEASMVGMIFVRMTRAKRRSATLAFSHNAVICERDGKLTFMFRVGDLRTKTHLLETNIRAQLVRRKITLEGEVVNFYQEELAICSHKEKYGKILLFWPTLAGHTIDASSPLYHLHPTRLTIHNQTFEIIVVLEGIVEGTGQLAQARTSYLPAEILWGHRFEELTSDIKTVLTGERVIDYSKFHKTYPVPTRMMSAAEIDAAAHKSVYADINT